MGTIPDASRFLTAYQVKNLPVISPQFRGRIGQGEIPPNDVVYTIGGGLMPALPADPDLPRALSVAATGKLRNGKLPNGLTRRADVMARLMARGAGTSAAYRAAYNAMQSDPVDTARNAGRVAGVAGFRRVVSEYRMALEAESRQQAIGLGDFVKSRLVKEAQTARNDGARIRALELLGKTEGMFMDVKRTEKSLSAKDVTALKSELNQRLKEHLLRLAPQLVALGTSQDTGTDMAIQAPTGDEIAMADPHQGAAPLIASGSHPGSEDSIPPVQTPVFTDPPIGSPDLEHPRVGSPGSQDGQGALSGLPPLGASEIASMVHQNASRPYLVVPLGEAHREMSMDDL